MAPDALTNIAKPQLASALLASVLRGSATPARAVELRIRIRSHDVDVRGLRYYLTFIDRSYGRLASAGLPSYAQRSYGRLSFSEIRNGSWEAIVIAALNQGTVAATVIVIGLLLKHLPSLLASAGAAYRDFEEGRLTREKRRQLRAEIEAADIERYLTKHQREQVLSILEALMAANPRDAQRAARFSADHVHNVQLQAGKSESDLTERK